MRSTDPRDPSILLPERRRREIAAILAGGLNRHLKRRYRIENTEEKVAESGQDGLELSGETRLHVSHG